MARVVVLSHGTESIVADIQDIEAEKEVETSLEETQIR